MFGIDSINSILSRSLSQSNFKLNEAAYKLATGKRLNSAKDDAAAISISQGFISEIRGLDQAIENSGDGISMLNTAEGALSVISDDLQRARELAVQAGNGTNSADELSAIQAEIDQIMTNVSDMSDDASFNGINLLDGSAGTVNIQSGTGTGDVTAIDLSSDFSADAAAAAGTINEGNTGGAAGVALNNIDVTSGNIDDIITGLDNAIENVSTMRSDIGSSTNSLNSSISYLEESKINVIRSNSRIEDADIAKVMSAFSQAQANTQIAAKTFSMQQNQAQFTYGLFGL